jgi:hypothetical protein
MKHVLSLGVTAAVAAVVAAWLWQGRAHREWAARIAMAQEHLRQRDQLRDSNQALRASIAALSTLRRLQEERAAADRWAPDTGARPAGYTSRADLTNKGNATPGDAYETLWWALDRQDIPTLAKLFTFEPKAKQRLDAYFASLPPEVQDQFGTSEQLFATLYANHHPLYFDGAEVTGVNLLYKQVATVDVSLEYEGQIRDHPAVQTLRLGADGGWGLMTSTGDVTSTLSKIGSHAKPSAGGGG